MVEISSRKPIRQHGIERLSREDAEELRNFYRRGGAAIFQYSSMAAQLDRAMRYSIGAEPCEGCGGNRVTGRAGSGVVPANQRRHERALAAELAEWRAQGLEPPKDYPAPCIDNARICGDCQGAGWQSVRLSHLPSEEPPKDPARWEIWEKRRVTARPTGSSKRGRSAAAFSIDEVDVAQVAITARRLAAVTALNPAAARVLGAYYGSDSDLIQIYPLTRAGQRLLRRSGNAQLELSPVQRLEADLHAQTKTPSAGRKALLDRAHGEAQDLYEAACRSWNRVVHGVGAEPTEEGEAADEEPEPMRGAA